MPDVTQLQGELQLQIMAALWRIQAGTVQDVRDSVPPRYRSSHNTVQTVLNRLTERGLLERTRQGRAFVYRPRISEADYVTRSIRQSLAGASNDARTAALAHLVGSMDDAELAELRERARDLHRRRSS
jgi:predicted transcriptional regulator